MSSDRGAQTVFDRGVEPDFRGAQISSDGGFLVMPELDDALGLSDLASAVLRDASSGKNKVDQLDGLFPVIGIRGAGGTRGCQGH